MFQQEVAERICAAPGTEAYGRLGVLAQFVCDVGLRLRIAAGRLRAAAESLVGGGDVHSTRDTARA